MRKLVALLVITLSACSTTRGKEPTVPVYERGTSTQKNSDPEWEKAQRDHQRMVERYEESQRPPNPVTAARKRKEERERKKLMAEQEIRDKLSTTCQEPLKNADKKMKEFWARLEEYRKSEHDTKADRERRFKETGEYFVTYPRYPYLTPEERDCQFAQTWLRGRDMDREREQEERDERMLNPYYGGGRGGCGSRGGPGYRLPNGQCAGW